MNKISDMNWQEKRDKQVAEWKRVLENIRKMPANLQEIVQAELYETELLRLSDLAMGAEDLRTCAFYVSVGMDICENFNGLMRHVKERVENKAL